MIETVVKSANARGSRREVPARLLARVSTLLRCGVGAGGSIVHDLHGLATRNAGQGTVAPALAALRARLDDTR